MYEIPRGCVTRALTHKEICIICIICTALRECMDSNHRVLRIEMDTINVSLPNVFSVAERLRRFGVFVECANDILRSEGADRILIIMPEQVSTGDVQWTSRVGVQLL